MTDSRTVIEKAMEIAASSGHALLSPSGGSTWANCPGSVRAQIGLPDESSPFAAEGTVAHWLGERALMFKRPTEAFIGDKHVSHPEWPVTEEMAEYVQQYVDYCSALKGRHHVEVRVDISPWVPAGFGTVDFFAVDEGICHIVDLKYGRGNRVEAENNLQLIMYALGVYNDFNFIYEIDTFVLSICQPRLDHISEWSIRV